MPPFRELRCETCGHEWDDIDLTRSVTVGTIDWRDETTFTLYGCPGCYLSLRVQRVADGNSWRVWRDGLRRVPGDLDDELIARVADRVSAILSARRTIYQPVAIELGELHCERCQVPLVLGPIGRPHPECAKCRSVRVVETGGWGMVVLGEPFPDEK